MVWLRHEQRPKAATESDGADLEKQHFPIAVSQVSKSHYLQCQEPTRLNPEHTHKLSSPKLTGK